MGKIVRYMQEAEPGDFSLRINNSVVCNMNEKYMNNL